MLLKINDEDTGNVARHPTLQGTAKDRKVLVEKETNKETLLLMIKLNTRLHKASSSTKY